MDENSWIVPRGVISRKRAEYCFESTPPPPPRENITKIIRTEYFCVISGAVTAKLRNYQEINSPRIILRNWRPQRPQTCPCWVTRNLRNSQENISQIIILRNWLRETVAITPKIIPQEFFCVSNFLRGGYCFGEENSLSFGANSVSSVKKTRWVRFVTQIIGWEELTEFSPRNSVRAKKLTEFGVWNRARPVSEFPVLHFVGRTKKL